MLSSNVAPTSFPPCASTTDVSNEVGGRSKFKDVGEVGRQGGKEHGASLIETPFPGLPLLPQKWWHRARDPPLQLQMSSTHPQRRRGRKKPQEPREEVRGEA